MCVGGLALATNGVITFCNGTKNLVVVLYKYRDNRFVTQAIDKAAHNGYQTWHRNDEKQVEAWLDQHLKATPAEFEAYLFDLYKTDGALNWRFPNGL